MPGGDSRRRAVISDKKKKKNHLRIIKVGKDHKDHLVQPSAHKLCRR